MLEHSEPKEHADGDDDKNQANAEHAHSSPTTHLSAVIDEQTKVSVFLFWEFGIWEIRMRNSVGGNCEENAEFKRKGKQGEEEGERRRKKEEMPTLMSLSRVEEF